MINIQLTEEQARLVLTAIEQEINAGQDTFLSNHNVADLSDAAELIAEQLQELE